MLLKLNDNYASLLINNREWIVKRDFVNESMEGDFRLIWPLPAGEETVSRKSGSEAQMKLYEMLNRYEDTDTYAFNGYDKTMANRVKKVQQSLGIKADGYAGIDTLWALLPYTETDIRYMRNILLLPNMRPTSDPWLTATTVVPDSLKTLHLK